MVSIERIEAGHTETLGERVERIVMERGAAVAFVGCFLFWLTLGIAVYFAL